MIPRIRGSAYQKENGKWTCFMEACELGSNQSETFDCNFDFDTQAEAIEELKKVCQIACETFEKAMGFDSGGKFIDMKTNETRYWDKRDEN